MVDYKIPKSLADAVEQKMDIAMSVDILAKREQTSGFACLSLKPIANAVLPQKNDKETKPLKPR